MSKTPTRKRRPHYSHRRSMFLISLILLFLSIILGSNMLSVRERNQAFTQQERELNALITEQKMRAEEITAYASIVHTEEYLLQVAQERLGLVNPNDIIFVPVTEIPSSVEEDVAESPSDSDETYDE